jgi:HPt (histidine-containing phosphotransfer) domain-containing protein
MRMDAGIVVRGILARPRDRRSTALGSEAVATESALDAHTLHELRESVGGDQEFVAELIDAFERDAPRQLESLRAATTSGDLETARRAAHTLKSSGRTFGAVAFASTCQEAEAAAAGGDLESVGQRIEAIAEQLDQVLAELRAVRDGS